MKPGTGETLAVFDNIREITTLELGRRSIGIEDPGIRREKQLESYSEGQLDFSQTKLPLITPVYQRTYMPVINVKEQNYSEARASLETVMTLDGVKGMVAKITGRKRLARNMLDFLTNVRAEDL